MGKILIEVTEIKETTTSRGMNVEAVSSVEVDGVSSFVIGDILGDVIVELGNMVKNNKQFYDALVSKVAENLPM